MGRSHNFVVGDGAVRAESNLLKKSYARKGRPGLELLYLAIMERGYRDYLQSLKDGKVKPPEREVTKEKMIQKARDIYFGDIDANRPGLHLISARRYPSKLLSGLRIGTDDDEQVYLDKTFKY